MRSCRSAWTRGNSNSVPRPIILADVRGDGLDLVPLIPGLHGIGFAKTDSGTLSPGGAVPRHHVGPANIPSVQGSAILSSADAWRGMRRL